MIAGSGNLVGPPWHFGVSRNSTFNSGSDVRALVDLLTKWWDLGPADDYRLHRHVVLNVEPGDATTYWMIVTDLRGISGLGRPEVGLSFLNTYRSVGTFRAIELDPSGIPYAHEVGYVSAVMGIPEGVLSAGLMATLFLGLACRG